jgi:hypothetical protein
VLWLLIALTLIATALAMKGSTRTCTISWPATCAKPTSTHFSGLARYQIIS